MTTHKQQEERRGGYYRKHPSGVERWDIYDHLPSNMAAALAYVWRADHKGQRAMDLRKAADHLHRQVRVGNQAMQPPLSTMMLAEAVKLHEPDDTFLFHLLECITPTGIDTKHAAALAVRITLELDAEARQAT